jgi:hypothetical protein
LPLFPVRSELAAIKDGTGAVKVDTVLEEIAELKQLQALGLPEALFGATEGKLRYDPISVGNRSDDVGCSVVVTAK